MTQYRNTLEIKDNRHSWSKLKTCTFSGGDKYKFKVDDIDNEEDNSMMDEVWKDVVDYEGIYQVSNKGRVKSLAREFKHMRRGEEITRQYKEERIINGTTDSRGNVYIILSSVRDGKQVMERRMLGQVVGTAFVDNPEKYTTIKHIDDDKSNNCADNLRWVAWKDSNVGLKKRPVLCVTDNTAYPSVWECSRQCNINRSTLQSHLRSGIPLNDKLYIYLDE